MIFSSFYLVETSKLAFEIPLRRLADENILQQPGKNLQTGGRNMAKLTFVKFANRLIQSLQQVESLWSDARLHDAAIVGLPRARNQAALLHAVEEARHVWIMRNHAVTNAAARETLWFGAAEDAKDVVLRAGEAGGF